MKRTPHGLKPRIELTPAAPGLVRVEALYPFEWDLLRAGARSIEDALIPLLIGLPGALNDPAAGFRWFNRTEDRPPFLWASIEPTGLLVGGTLTKREWSAWRAAFERQTGEVPYRSGAW